MADFGEQPLSLEEALAAIAAAPLSEDRKALLQAELYLDVDENKSSELLQSYLQRNPEKSKDLQPLVDEFATVLSSNATDKLVQADSILASIGRSYCGECTAFGGFTGRWAYDPIKKKFICRPC